MNVPIIERQSDLLKRFIKEIGVKGEFVEVGCGEGHNLELLSNMGLRGIGIDISEEAINLARNRNLKNVRLINADFNKVNLENKELVLFLFVLEHIEDDLKALRKINSFLKKGGHLIISVPAHSRLYSIQDRLAGHHRRYDREEIIKKLRDTGFYVKKVFSFGFPVSNIYLFIYNFLLSLHHKEDKVMVEHTKITGIRSKKSHMPGFFRIISKVAFPILTFLIKLDSLFLETDLGTHYIILAEKIED